MTDTDTGTDTDLYSLFRVRPDLVSEQLFAKLGVEVTRLEPGRVEATMPVAGNRQHIGLLAGGANAAFAETVGSLAAALDAAPSGACVGVELHCTHHRAVRSGTVTAVATPIHRGDQLTNWEVAIADERGRRVCTAQLTCMTSRR